LQQQTTNNSRKDAAIFDAKFSVAVFSKKTKTRKKATNNGKAPHPTDSPNMISGSGRRRVSVR